MDELFRALAAPGRRRLLDTLEHQRASAARAGDDPHRLTTDSTLRSMISHGRPELISGLTTLLETGEALPQH